MALHWDSLLTRVGKKTFWKFFFLQDPQNRVFFSAFLTIFLLFFHFFHLFIFKKMDFFLNNKTNKNSEKVFFSKKKVFSPTLLLTASLAAHRQSHLKFKNICCKIFGSIQISTNEKSRVKWTIFLYRKMFIQCIPG